MSLAYAMVALLVLSVAALGVACLVLLVRLLMSTTTPAGFVLADGPSVGRAPVDGAPIGAASAGGAEVASDPEATVSVIRQR